MNSSQFALEDDSHQEPLTYEQNNSPIVKSHQQSPQKNINSGKIYGSLHSDDNEELEVQKPLFDPNSGVNNENINISNSNNLKSSSKLGLAYSENKENTDLTQQYNIPNMMSVSSGIKKSSSQIDIMNTSIGNAQNDSNVQYEQENFDDGDSNGNQSMYDNLTQNTEQKQDLNSQNVSQADSKKKKGQQKRSMSKDVKILQTMKAYFPQLAQAEPKKVIQHIQPNPTLNKIYGQRSNTTNQGKSIGQHSERIIFVENRRRAGNQDQTIDYKNKQQSIERRNSQINNSTTTIVQSQNTVASKNADQLRKNTQLPPIGKRSQVQVLDQQSAYNISPRNNNTLNKILSPLSTNQQFSNTDTNSQQHWSDKKKYPKKLLQTTTMNEYEIQMVNGIILEGTTEEQQRLQQQKIDYERKNQEMIQRMQEKKNQEMKMIEEERRKLQKRQEKLKNMILKQAADVREKKLRQEEEAKRRQQDEQNQQPTKKTPKKKPYIPQPSSYQLQAQKQQMEMKEENEDLGEEEEKKKMDMLKKYYRSRYATFLKTIQEKNKKRDEEMEQQRKKDEKRKAKLQEELGIQKIQSRFMDDAIKINKEANEKVVIEHIQNKKQKIDDKPRRGNSIIGIKSMTSTSNFNQTGISNNDSVSDIQKIYVPDSQKRNRSNSRSEKRALTPKVKKSKRVIVMPIDEKTEEDFEKEMKAKKDAAEKIKMRQQKYLQDLAERKEKETQKVEEEKKKKEKLMILAREQAKHNFDKVNQQPGLKELQEQQIQKKQSSEDDEDGEDTEKKKKKKKKAVKAEGQLDSFLERNNPKKVIFPNITDLATWKKKYKVEDNTKVFICTGGYPDIKKALKKRGWVENKDSSSPCFDLKWVLKSKDIDHNTLNDTQLVNHFNKATAITTKVGLCHNLKNLIWFNNVDIDTFYPRCFDLAMQEDCDDFIEEFKGVKAESYLKQWVREMRESMGEKPSTVTDKILKVALKVCEKRLRELDDLIDDPNAFNSLVTDDEWSILGADELNVETLAKQKHDNWLAKNEVMQQEKKRKEAKDAKDQEKKKKKKKKKVKKVEQKDGEGNPDEDYENDEDVEGWNKKPNEDDEDIIDDEEDEKAKVEQDIDLQLVSKHPEYKRAIKILEGLKAKYPQYSLNGEKNIWIVKPAGSSRGRGIALYNQLIEILDLCKQKESQYIAQKYIENSLIVKCRKFDIRQWVLVTDWNPLTVWVYQEPYFRFPASDYTDENIMDRFIHLTNNSVAKYAEKAKVTHEIEGNMWCWEEMKNYLQEEFGWDVWEDKLKEQTNNIIINCLESVQDMFECKPGCFELFGFDLMVDDEFNMWLIEVNSSPAMDYSTSVTERLVKIVLEDTIKVVVDHAQAKKKSKVDTGLFECIYKASKIVDKPINSFGLNLVCEGKKLAPTLALSTVVLLASGFQTCETANLRFAMVLIFLVYSVVFVMMLLQFIGLVSCLKTIPRAIMGFYFSLVGVMFFVQMILFKGDECRTQAPVYYFWLVGQIALFYLIVACGLARWGSYICWQAENHDTMAKKAVEEYMKQAKKGQLMMIENDDKKVPLLSKSSSENESYASESSDEDEEQNKKGKKLPKQLAIGN